MNVNSEIITFKTYIKFIVEELSRDTYNLKISRPDLEHIAYTELILYQIENIKTNHDLNNLVMKCKLWLENIPMKKSISCKKLKKSE
jgi:hypothetical protein